MNIECDNHKHINEILYTTLYIPICRNTMSDVH